MSRLMRTLVLFFIALLPLTAVLAQRQAPPPPPAITPVPGSPTQGALPPFPTQGGGFPGLPTGGAPGFPTPAAPGFPTQGAGTPGAQPGPPLVLPTQPAVLPEVTAEITSEATLEATAEPEVNAALELLISLRPDIELLADALIGVGQRPEGWSGTLDINDSQLPLLMRLDLELLAGTVLGAEVRPREWFGTVSSTPYALARDIRHDLEVLADATVGRDGGGRPAGWIGAEPIMRCSRATQSLVGLLQASGVFQLSVDPTAPDFCAQVEVQASQFTEVNLLANPAQLQQGGLASIGTGAGAGTATIINDFAAAFLDRGASLRVGVIPNGLELTPIARSYSQFSNMMLVRGADFELFIDYQFTSVSEDQFEALPDVDSITIDPYCAADWCEAG
ncbi:MAG: hypothetical protein SF029_10040 [bacterium]|nr:hypothetical protein [bacterium]